MKSATPSKKTVLCRVAATLFAVAFAAVAVMAIQPWQAEAATQPVGTVCAYFDAEGTKPIDNEGPQQVYDVDQVVSAVEQLGSASFIKSIRIELSADWNTKSAGRIVVGEGMTLYLNLHGHMLNRAKAGSYGDKWYAEKEGEVVYVKKNGTLVVDGGTGDEAATSHPGTLEDNDRFWSYGEGGTDAITGGLITGGACDDEHGSGGISLAGENAKAYLKNVTVAGNLTDQFDSSYGHGAGVALHGKSCYLELSNSKVCYNHAEGTGGGIYVRKDECTVKVTGGSEVACNLGILGGGGVYVDGNDCALSVDASKISDNSTHKDGGGVYFNCKRGSITLENGGKISGNGALKDGGGIYDCYNDTAITLKGADTEVSGNTASDDGGGIYLEDAATLTLSGGAKISGNKADNGAGVYVNDSDTTITLNDNSEIAENSTTADNGCGGGIYHNGSDGSVILNGYSKIRANRADKGSGGAIYNCFNGTKFEINGTSSICDNFAGTDGGAFYLNDKATIDLNGRATIDSNDSDGRGGAVYVDESSTSITLNNNAQVSANHSAYGGAFYIDGSTTLQLNGNGCVTRNYANQGGAVYCDATFKVVGENANTCKIIDNGYESSYAQSASIYARKDLYLDNVTVGQTSSGGISSRADIYYDNTGTDTSTFELTGVVKITSVCLERVQRITGGKLEAGSSVGVYAEGEARKIAELGLVDGLLDEDGNQTAVYAIYDAQKVETRSDGIYLNWGSSDRTITLYNEDGTEVLDTMACNAWSTKEFDNTKYADENGEYPLWWDWKLHGTEGTGRSYPNENGVVPVNVTDVNMTLYAYYGSTRAVTLKYGDNVVETKKMIVGLKSELSANDYKRNGVAPTSWKVTQKSDGSSWTIYSTGSNKKASFVMPDSELVLEAQYPTVFKSLSITLGESAEYDDIGGGVADDSGKIAGVTVDKFEVEDTNGDKVRPDAGALSSGFSFFTRAVEENSEKTAKELSYWVYLNSDLLTSCDIELSSELTADDIDASVSLPFIGTVKADIGYMYTLGNLYCIEISVDYVKPSDATHAVAVKAANVNDTSQTLATLSYRVAENGSVEVPTPEVAGWSFSGWDKSSLPECASLDETAGTVTVSKPSDNVELTALFKPLASKVELQVAQLEVGKAFPSALESCKVSTYEEQDISSAFTSAPVVWRKPDGSDAGSAVEAGSYIATITVNYSKETRDFDWAADVAVFANGSLASDFLVDAGNSAVTVSYPVTVGDEAAYDKADESGLTQATINVESEYTNYLPSSIAYSLTDGTELTASITWSNKTVEDAATGGFKAVGSFKDKFGASHEVSRSFVVSFTAATPSIKAGTYAAAQRVKLVKGDDWIDPDQVEIYYAIDKTSSASAGGLDFTKYNEGDVIEISESCMLFVYAKKSGYQLGTASYAYTIKGEHAVKVNHGSACDSHDEAISAAVEGKTVYLQAEEPPAGKRFDKWVAADGTDIKFKDAARSSTSFTMPAADVEVTATYKDASAEPVEAASADVELSSIAAGDTLPVMVKVRLADAEGGELAVVTAQLQWSTADGEVLGARAKAEAGKTYTVTAALALDEDSTALLTAGTKVSFSGKAAKSQSGPDSDGVVTASFAVSVPSETQPDPEPTPTPATKVAKTVSYKGCTYTLSGKVLVLTKVNKKSMKSVTVPAKIKINGKMVKVTKIKAKAFKGTKVKKLTVKSPYLTKKGVKNCLKGSKVKTVKVKAAAKKKANKKLVKKYRKCFTKANCGKKVKVK
ncbi:MAG: hypothetical protein Q4A43_04430 [Coriobacteriia bacterium]|nr:hypothetical protein [Coriobacteriia bacterium]